MDPAGGYTKAEIDALRERINALDQRVMQYKDELGFLGGVYCGYLRALNDVRWELIQMDLDKVGATMKEISKDIADIENTLFVKYGIGSPGIKSE